MSTHRKYHDYLIESLREDVLECAEYWDAALEESALMFGIAAGNVAEALEVNALRYANLFVAITAASGIVYVIFANYNKKVTMYYKDPNTKKLVWSDSGYWEWDNPYAPFTERNLVLHKIIAPGQSNKQCEDMLKAQYKKYCKCMRFGV